MKKLLLLILALGFFSCNEDEVLSSMAPEELAGTYWKQTERYYYFIEDDGKLQTNGNELVIPVDGTNPPTILYFPDDHHVTEYVRIGVTNKPIRNFYRTGTFEYDLARNRITADFGFLDFGAGQGIEVEVFAPSKIILKCTNRDSTFNRYVFVPYVPTDEWRRQAAQYPDYDKIDWSAVNK